MSISARIIILPLSIVLHYCLNKTLELTFIGCHNIRLQPCSKVVTTSVHAPSWHDDVRACALTRFVPYPLHKFRLVAMAYFCPFVVPCLIHGLCPRTTCAFVFFSLRLHAVEIFLRTIFLCLHDVSCPVSFCIHAGFDFFSPCIHVILDLLLVWPNLNHISNTQRNCYIPRRLKFLQVLSFECTSKLCINLLNQF